MISLKKILVGIMIATYPLSLQSDLVFAKSKKSSSKKKNRKSKKKNSKSSLKSASPQVSSAADYEEQVSYAQESSPVVSTTVSASVVSESVSTTDSSTVAVATDIDVSKDANWENFRICMQSNCSDGDDSPNNVKCYKNLTFDEVFANCKMLVEEGKRESFKNYFSGPFLTAEKKAFCEGDMYNGKYNEATGKCAITVTYTRPAYNGKQFKCKAEKKTTTWYLDGKNYVCSAEIFNVDDCYQDSAGYETAKMKKTMGGINLAMGAVTGLVASLTTVTKITAAVTDKTKETDNSDSDSSSTQPTPSSTEENKNKATWYDKAAAGLSAGAGSLTQGIAEMAEGDILMKQKGDRFFGSCVLPNEERIAEGNARVLHW